MLKIFIGYDPREAVAFHTCANSIIRHATQPVCIVPLALNHISNYTESHGDGSNEFIYSRFLVPYLSDFNGWSLFVDGDMIFRDDIGKLVDLIEHDKAVMVVQHDYKTRQHEKYLGAPNADYPRKNWSSVVFWNCQHYLNRQLTPDKVQRASGAELHRFTWLPDDRIGTLPIEWNWLPDEFGENKDAKLLHWTLGTPCFHEEQFANAPMATEWHRERMLMNYSAQKDRPGNIK